jgi:carbon-monoxide dehydrogenase large subunit
MASSNAAIPANAIFILPLQTIWQTDNVKPAQIIPLLAAATAHGRRRRRFLCWVGTPRLTPGAEVRLRQFGIGQPVRRVEDRRFLTGRGHYLDDIVRPRQAYAAMLRSPHAHARIATLDTAAAAAAPGVLAVFTGADLVQDEIGTIPCVSALTNRDGSAMAMPKRPAIVADRVRHVGDTVAIVVAESEAAARDAAELIAVDYRPLPAIVDLRQALLPGQPTVWDTHPDNLAFDWETGDAAAVQRAAATARHRVSLHLVNNRVVVNSMEPRGAIGEYDAGEDSYTLWSSTQGSHFVRNLLAEHVFHVPENRIRVVTRDVGGGFGMKLFLYPEHALVLWAARRLGRPVKWVPDRADAFMTDTQGRDNLVRLDLARRRIALSRPVGRAHREHGGLPVEFRTRDPDLPRCGHVQRRLCLPGDPCRGQGRLHQYRAGRRLSRRLPAGAAIGVERLIDYAARELGVGAAELRRRNFIRAAAMPYTTPLGLTYDSGDFARNLGDALAAADAAGFAARRRDGRARGRYRGLGHAVYIEQSGFPPDEFAEARFDPAGTLTLLMGSQSSGQGHQTAYAQVAADKLGLALEKIRVLQGDTDAIAFGRGTGGSRSLPIGGAALAHAADKLIAKGTKIAAHLLEAAEADIAFGDGLFAIAGTDRNVSIDTVARAAFNPAQLPPGLEPGFAESGHFTPPAPTFPNGCHVCEVEIDPETGHIDIVRYLVVDDFGAVINPLLPAGQVHGGIAQGIGQAMLECTVYDMDSGQLLSGDLTDYAVPHADTLPALEFSYNVVPCRTNPLGVKGAGEAGAIGAPPAFVNAVIDAVAELGIDHLDMPLTPERLWRALADAATPKPPEVGAAPPPRMT